MKQLGVRILIVLLLLFSASLLLPFSISLHASASTPSRHLGFWIDMRDIWSGDPYTTGTITPQLFFNDYFASAPYPSTMTWAFDPVGGSGPTWPGSTGSSNWFGQLLGIADHYPNIKIVALFFLVTNGSDPWDSNGNVVNQSALNTMDYWLSQVAGHHSLLGVEPEAEYVSGGATLAIINAFYQQTVKYGVPYLQGTGYPNPDPSGSCIDYSTYPYYGGTINTNPKCSSQTAIGISYGETGAPNCNYQNPCPIWTQSTVLSIVDKSGGSYLIINSWKDRSNPIGNDHLELNPTLRGWIWSDSFYQSNFILSNDQTVHTSTLTTSVSSRINGSLLGGSSLFIVIVLALGVALVLRRK